LTQVREWVDESRRKVAVALRDLSDELSPQSEEPETPTRDASTREDESPEAVERRRQVRQELLERGRKLEEARRAKREAKGKAKSFDDMVDKDGALRNDEENNTATTTAAEPQPEGSGLRYRATESHAAALGAAFANPFADEAHLDSSSTPLQEEPTPIREETPQMHEEPTSISRASTPTLPSSPPVPPKPAAYQPHMLLIDTASEPSHHESEALLDLTPTTSASPSTFSAAADLAELTPSNHGAVGSEGDGIGRQPGGESYWSVNEWAMNHSAQRFYSPPQSEAGAANAGTAAQAQQRSREGSLERVSQMGSEDADVVSMFSGEGVDTPGSWSEVASQVSEEGYIGRV